MSLTYALALLVTLAVEIPLAAWLGGSAARRRVLLDALLLNLLTHPSAVGTCGILIGLGLPWDLIGRIIVAAYLFKVLIALLDTPFVYLGVALVRRLAAPGKAAA